jgi:type IV secretory pathway VirB2 component (pilin)
MTMADGSPRKGRSLVVPLTGVVIGAVLIGIELSQGARWDRAAGGMVILFVYAAALWFFQSRSETVSTLAGRPVDELWQSIHQRAMAATATIAAIVALVGFGAMELLGRDNWQFALMAGVIGAGYIAGIIWYRWRS